MWMIFGGVFAGLLGADELLKQYVEDNLKNNEEIDLVGDRFVLRKVYNKGFAMNTMEDKPEIVKGVSAAIGVVILAYDLWLFTRRGHWMEKLSMSILSAGAASNIFDRLVRGKVIDYIGMHSKHKKLSQITINLADICVVVSAVMLAIIKKP